MKRMLFMLVGIMLVGISYAQNFYTMEFEGVTNKVEISNTKAQEVILPKMMWVDNGTNDVGEVTATLIGSLGSYDIALTSTSITNSSTGNFSFPVVQVNQGDTLVIDGIQGAKVRLQYNWLVRPRPGTPSIDLKQ